MNWSGEGPLAALVERLPVLKEIPEPFRATEHQELVRSMAKLPKRRSPRVATTPWG